MNGSAKATLVAMVAKQSAPHLYGKPPRAALRQFCVSFLRGSPTNDLPSHRVVWRLHDPMRTLIVKVSRPPSSTPDPAELAALVVAASSAALVV